MKKIMLLAPMLLITAAACDSDNNSPLDEPTSFELETSTDVVDPIMENTAETREFPTNVGRLTVDSISIDRECTAFGKTIVKGQTVGLGWLSVGLGEGCVTVSTDSINVKGKQSYGVEIYLSAAGENKKIEILKMASSYGYPELVNPFAEPEDAAMTFTADGGTQTMTIRTDGHVWLLEQATIGDETFDIQDKAFNVTEYTFRHEWLTVDRNGENLTITLEPNPDPASRAFTIRVASGPVNGFKFYNKRITGTQQGR